MAPPLVPVEAPVEKPEQRPQLRKNFSSTSKYTEEELKDPRAPLYLGDWERSIPYVDEDFARDEYDEPHMKRKRAILAKYPDIPKLYGYDPTSVYVAFAGVGAQLGLAYCFGHVWTDTWIWMLVVAYAVGGTITSIFGVLLHECTHNLVAKSPLVNKLVGLLCNVGIPVPISASFRRYHLEHHTYQGVEGMDPDLPLAWELRLIRGNALLKLVWLFFYPMMYVVRGMAQGKTPSKWERINMVAVIASDALVVYFCGIRGIVYLLLSLWTGYGLHPGAAHFIQEHYTFEDGQETYSYYGILNRVFLNIGYHNEHHDFVKIPWSKLPELKAMAPEYYDTLAYHTSWVMVLYCFITDSFLGPQSRAVRSVEEHRRGRAGLAMLKRQE
ncbi:MAG: fatty acid desaturase-domain-containing protein [Piptocephalis tieghemiana]|nr:MAG: fatty acid desaturase-domain-containing protein [Piptocephalis tieghemiana]